MRTIITVLALVCWSVAHAEQYVVIENSTGHVVNRIIAAPGTAPGAGYTLAPDVGQQIYAPAQPVVVPQSVTMAQAKAALLASPKVGAGPTLLDDANAAVTAIGGAAVIAWQYAPQIDRHSPTMTAVQVRLGLTDSQVDALFVAAAGIQF